MYASSPDTLLPGMEMRSTLWEPVRRGFPHSWPHRRR